VLPASYCACSRRGVALVCASYGREYSTTLCHAAAGFTTSSALNSPTGHRAANACAGAPAWPGLDGFCAGRIGVAGHQRALQYGTLHAQLCPLNVSRVHAVGPRLEEVTTEDNDASSKIAVVEVDGIITGRVMDQGGYSIVDIIKAQLKRAEEDDKVKAVILKVDSPGGEVLASDEISRAISEFQTKLHGKAGGVLYGESGRVRRLLRFGPLPLDCGE